MIDSRTAAHVALYAALNAETAVTDLADVWGHAPEDTQPTAAKGIVQVGFASATNEGGKDGGFDEVTIDVLASVREPDATALYALSTAVRNAIEAQNMSAPGADIGRPEFVSVEPDLLDDGETYVDRLTFKMFVQAS
jgi:hypothetical protein